MIVGRRRAYTGIAYFYTDTTKTCKKRTNPSSCPRFLREFHPDLIHDLHSSWAVNKKNATPRILTPQKWLFWGPGPLLYRFKPFHWRVQGFLGHHEFLQCITDWNAFSHWKDPAWSNPRYPGPPPWGSVWRGAPKTDHPNTMKTSQGTVDGRNPKQPPGMYIKPCKWWEKLPTSTG